MFKTIKTKSIVCLDACRYGNVDSYWPFGPVIFVSVCKQSQGSELFACDQLVREDSMHKLVGVEY